MKFGQLIELKWEIFFFKNHAENVAGRLVLELFLFFEKALYKTKESFKHLSLIYFGGPRFGHRIKQICSISGCRSRDKLNFDLLEKDLEIISPPHFV